MPEVSGSVEGVVGESRVGTLLLSRPEKRNALSLAMWRAIPGAVARLAGDPAVRAVIVTGAGGHFCAGADIGEFETVYATRASAAEYAAAMAAATEALAACPKPVIAMIRGVCVGGGMSLALRCDLRFAAADTRFAITPARLGLIYSFADTKALADRVGVAAAADLLFSAREVEAGEASRLRLADRVVPAELLEAETRDYAARLGALSAETIGTTKRFLRAMLNGQTRETEATRSAFLDALERPDFAEGRAAFLAKRRPRFGPDLPPG